MVKKAVFPVGGLGTRFLPATKAMPKEMLPVVDKPLIQYAVEEAKAAGIEEFIFVTGRGKSAIEDHFDHSFELRATLAERGKTEMLDEILSPVMEPGQICYVRQQEPLGLGHAIWCARHLIGDEPFAILLADDLIKADTPCLAQMVEAHGYYGGNMIAVMEVPEEQVSRYGIVDPGDKIGNVTQVRGLIEKPARDQAPSNLAVIGRYILQPQIFRYLDTQEKGSGGEIQLTDSMAQMIGKMPFHGLTFAGKRFDCGDKTGFLAANLAFALERPDMHDDVVAAMKALLS